MAHETEVKFRIGDAEPVIVALKDLGVELGPPVTQDDQAYAPADWQFGDPKIGRTFVRLRTVDGIHVFTSKTPVLNAQACDEHESTVADRDGMHGAIVAMGYRPTSRVRKTRRTARFASGDLDIAICLDEVDGAGTFLELEIMCADDTAAQATQNALVSWAATLGIDPAAQVAETYETLVRG